MGKATLSWLAVTLTLAGMAVITGHPAWGTVTGGAILILAAGAAAGAVRTKSERRIEERKVTGKKISNTLVTLSSAAILAVYAAGYQRTRAAADKFEAQAARRKAAALNATVVALGPVAPAVATPPEVPPPTVYPGAKSSATRSSPSQVRKGAPQPAPTKHSQAERPPASASSSTSPCWPNRPAELCLASNPATMPPDQSANSAATPAVAVQRPLMDGTYLGWGTSRHGDIQASVVIQNGKIESAAVATCATRYSCSVINPLRGEVVTRQSSIVDFISGATDSSEAFSDAVSEALSKASE